MSSTTEEGKKYRGSFAETLYNLFALMSKGVISSDAIVLYLFYRINNREVVTEDAVCSVTGFTPARMRRHRDALKTLGVIRFEKAFQTTKRVIVSELTLRSLIENFSSVFDVGESDGDFSTFSVIAEVMQGQIESTEAESAISALESVPDDRLPFALNLIYPNFNEITGTKGQDRKWTSTRVRNYARKRVDVLLDHTSLRSIYHNLSDIDISDISDNTLDNINQSNESNEEVLGKGELEIERTQNRDYTTASPPRLSREIAKKIGKSNNEAAVLRLLDPRFAIALQEWNEFELLVKSKWSGSGRIKASATSPSTRNRRNQTNRYSTRDILADEDWAEIYPIMVESFPEKVVAPVTVQKRALFSKVCRFYLDHKEDFREYARWYRKTKYPVKGFNWGLFCYESMFDEFMATRKQREAYTRTSTNLRRNREFKRSAESTKEDLKRIVDDDEDD